MIGMTKAQYARHRGVTRQAIDYAVKQGKIPPSAFIIENGKRLIDPAAADFALGETRERILSGDDDDQFGGAGDDPTFGSAAGRGSVNDDSAVSALTKARTATEIYRARTAELEYDQRVGKLLAIEDVTRAMEKCAGVIVRELDQMPMFADEIAAALKRDGVQGVRLALKSLARNVRSSLEASMKVVAAEGAVAESSLATGQKLS